MKKKPIVVLKRSPLNPPGRVKIPDTLEIPVFLLRHELKLRMIYEGLQPIATIDCYFETH